MASLSWDSEIDAWSGTISNDTFEQLVVRVVTDGELSRPTARQKKAVGEIESMTAADISRIGSNARAYAEANLAPSELEAMADEDFAVALHTAIVPQLNASKTTYVLFAGESEIDVEHGIGCIAKNGREFTIIDADTLYEEYSWDSVDDFEEFLRGKE